MKEHLLALAISVGMEMEAAAMQAYICGDGWSQM